MGAATQEMQQKVCQKYGWSYHYAKDHNGHWYVEVIVVGGGMNNNNISNNKYRFTSPNCSKGITQKEGRQHAKAEKEIVSIMALESLAPFIAQEEAKKCCQLSEAFPTPIQIYDSATNNGEIWKQFWNNPPAVVGIDTEGNQTSPPVLVQISTLEYTILEAPRTNKTLSSNLTRLLHDNAITKVFCDNFSHLDKIALGIMNNRNNDDHKQLPSNKSNSNNPSLSYDFTHPPIIDLEALSAQLYGHTNVARGLSKIVTMSMSELATTVRIVKPRTTSKRFKNIGRFALIEQGKAKPLKGVSDLSTREQQYCALDSWCTLQAYLSMKDMMMVEGGGGSGL